MYGQKASIETDPTARDEDTDRADELVNKVQQIKEGSDEAAEPSLRDLKSSAEIPPNLPPKRLLRVPALLSPGAHFYLPFIRLKERT